MKDGLATCHLRCTHMRSDSVVRVLTAALTPLVRASAPPYGVQGNVASVWPRTCTRTTPTHQILGSLSYTREIQTCSEKFRQGVPLTRILTPSAPLTHPRTERVWLCDQLGGPVVWVGGRFGVNGPQSQTPPEGTAAPCGTKGAPLCVDGIEGCVCVACCALPSVPCAL